MISSCYLFDDGHGDYNRSYENNEYEFDYADYSTDKADDNFFNIEKKKKPAATKNTHS
ncbi:MAG TPA: hypothetical protein IAB06_00205 [Candidatus Avacidaminococcus intestinavium]|uniref:Uncharacterized protein n=1 Tax=Candidatus Avacidaminococcus intestinavium TaxID=2840684 RepID=A0A9D1MNM9_9FIRM|nr:hypothetical protein [Candidatus Avacidaminococcus intestinavium]